MASDNYGNTLILDAVIFGALRKPSVHRRKRRRWMVEENDTPQRAVTPGSHGHSGHLVVVRRIPGPLSRAQHTDSISQPSRSQAARRGQSSRIQAAARMLFPSLRRLHVDLIIMSFTISPQSGVYVPMNAPQPEELFFWEHWAFPRSPIHLASLSITKVFADNFNFELNADSVELPPLQYLHFRDCDPLPFLNALITPSLSRLIVDGGIIASVLNPKPLSRAYWSLEELQWLDQGPDPTFSTLAHLAPNLRCYSNFIIGQEADIQFHYICTPPTIFNFLETLKMSIWSILEEILLDIGRISNIVDLIRIHPVRKRIRILKLPSGLQGELKEGMEEIFSKLRRRVDIAFGLDPWVYSSSG
ncbi:hypothetical protein FRB90_000622 [Tulasnella sp. 427]|nr:hypothetical protein FRB90_000622 [Tulasnella sp. 427]